MSVCDDADMKAISHLWFKCEYYDIDDKKLREQVIGGLWKLVKKSDFKQKYQVRGEGPMCRIYYGNALCLIICCYYHLVTLSLPLYDRKQINVRSIDDIYGLGGIYTCARNLFYHIASMEQRH